MSIQAVSWALGQDIAISSAKFVLVCFANYADQRGVCYPSQAQLCDDTGQDRKTVQLNVQRLVKAGLLRDTGQRIGATKGVIVYKIIGLPESSRRHFVYRTYEPSTGKYYIGKRSFDGEPKLDTYRGSGKWVLERLSRGATLVREILSEHMTSGEALAAEIVKMRECENDQFCMNDGTPRKHREAVAAQHKWRAEDREKRDSLDEDTQFRDTLTTPLFPESDPDFGQKPPQKRGTEPSGTVIDPNPPLGGFTPPAVDKFEAAWKTLPKRAGNNPKIDAQKAWNARINAGADPDVMLAAAARYRRFCEVTGKVGSEHVMRGSTFFGPGKPYEQGWEVPGPAGKVATPPASCEAELECVDVGDHRWGEKRVCRTHFHSLNAQALERRKHEGSHA